MRGSWFRTDEGGATSVEYALMAALIALAIFGAATSLGVSLSDVFGNDDLENVLTG